MSTEAEDPHRKEELQLAASFSDFRHSLNNSLAVIMALAEMTQRDPSRGDKLAVSVLEKGMSIMQNLREFTARFNETLSPEKREQ